MSEAVVVALITGGVALLADLIFNYRERSNMGCGGKKRK